MPRRWFVLRIPDGSIYAFRAPYNRFVYDKAHSSSFHFGMLALTMQGLSSVEATFIPLSTAQSLGSMVLPPFSTLIFFSPTRSLNGAASALRLVSVFVTNTPPELSSSLHLTPPLPFFVIVFSCLLCSTQAPTQKKTTSLSANHHVHAGSSLHFETHRSSLSSSSIVHRQFHITALFRLSLITLLFNMTHPSLKATSRLFIRLPTSVLIRLLCLLFYWVAARLFGLLLYRS